jgi:putative transcriptional regulator
MTPDDKPTPRLDLRAQDLVSPFKNRLLVSSPAQDGFFGKSLVYICAHDPEGAMGLVINQRAPGIQFSTLLSQLGIDAAIGGQDSMPIVLVGGPVEPARGFVLHSNDMMLSDTVLINDKISLTGTTDMLRAMAHGLGPERRLFTLGYAGWGPGQLEEEVKRGAWLTAPADEDLLFSPHIDGKWTQALSRLGIAPHALSTETGRA